MKRCAVLVLCFQLLNPAFGFAQDVTVKIGHQDSLYSNILDETRNLVVSLPDDYEVSGNSYPVLYLLDGTENNLTDARLVTYNLKLEVIIVAIANTNRDRDMMPLSRPSYKVENPQAHNFLSFLGEELIPHIETKYRTSEERTIRGRSLSGLFVMYAFLAKPELFNNYIGTCAGWFSDMNDYFKALADKAFKNKERFNNKKLFVANSLSDPFDPKQEIHKSILDFSIELKTTLSNRIAFEYKTYENAGHVPYSGFYDGMKFISESEKDE